MGSWVIKMSADTSEMISLSMMAAQLKWIHHVPLGSCGEFVGTLINSKVKAEAKFTFKGTDRKLPLTLILTVPVFLCCSLMYNVLVHLFK